MLLTSMNLRDYLLLKVELEGTSGEGSVQVRHSTACSCTLPSKSISNVSGCISTYVCMCCAMLRAVALRWNCSMGLQLLSRGAGGSNHPASRFAEGSLCGLPFGCC